MEVILHVGAHKTASTYLQLRLARSADHLAAHGIRAIVPAKLRERVSAAQTPLNPLNRVGRVRRGRQMAAIAELVREAEADGVARLVISEENLLGIMDPIVDDGAFYERAGGALAALWPSLARHRPRVALAIRSPASFYVSVWGYLLRRGRYVPFDARARRAALEADRGWADLVGDISAALPPGAAMTVWRYEDFARLEPAVLAELAGPAAPGLAPVLQHPLPGPTARAVRRLETIARTEGPPDEKTILRVLRVQTKAKGYKAYDPWTPGERDLLEQRYAGEVARIRAMPGVRFLDPVQSGVSM